ncbi:MAG: DNA primase [Chlorobi bacterium OLB4]|nr:MAG: DNA primase [Chlorobi bacterium OLB4]
MRISEEKINEIAQANDIVEVISSYTRVKNSGKSYLAICPFHQDKNPSMSISQEKRVYHCFSCGASGNLFKFVQNIEKITFMDAVEKLAQRAGIALDLQSYSPDLTNEITLLLEINKIAARYFHDTLFDLSGAEKDFIFSYLRKRNLKDYTIKKFGLGYAKKDWNSLHDYFRENTEFSDDNLEKAGLIVKSTKDNKYYDRFRGRLMFPIFNESGKVVAFGGRKLFEDDNTAKYINSPESKIYNKSKILYGLNFAKDSIRSEKRVLLVEGYMDLIALVQAKFTNCVSSSGTSLTDDQVKILSRYTSNVSILFDGDFAGIKAAKRGIEKILQGGAELRITVFPENEDPDSYIANKGINEFGQLINSGSDFIEFISNLLAKENKLKSVADKTNFIREIIYFISFIPDKIKRSFYIKKISFGIRTLRIAPAG